LKVYSDSIFAKRDAFFEVLEELIYFESKSGKHQHSQPQLQKIVVYILIPESMGLID
jgi:hypothetical protein